MAKDGYLPAFTLAHRLIQPFNRQAKLSNPAVTEYARLHHNTCLESRILSMGREQCVRYRAGRIDTYMRATTLMTRRDEEELDVIILQLGAIPSSTLHPHLPWCGFHGFDGEIQMLRVVQQAHIRPGLRGGTGIRFHKVCHVFRLLPRQLVHAAVYRDLIRARQAVQHRGTPSGILLIQRLPAELKILPVAPNARQTHGIVFRQRLRARQQCQQSALDARLFQASPQLIRRCFVTDMSGGSAIHRRQLITIRFHCRPGFAVILTTHVLRQRHLISGHVPGKLRG
ncbi:MAG: hypothetical protein BWY76_02264 [bacterium ADurb.Bin429]|nr:MAG: hypothetical protein BWY76_02264 [bacterium ADurb.Bin429]